MFSREPVLSPSILVGRIVLNGDAERLLKGMQYLWILDADFVEHQRTKAQGIDLERAEWSCFLLADAFRSLQTSAAWTEAHFVDVLKEVAVFDPDLAAWLHLVESPFILAALLANLKRTIRRFVDIRRLASPALSRTELLNEMGRCSELALHEDEHVYRSFVSWIPFLESLGYDPKICVRLCSVLFAVWKEVDLPLATFTENVERLSKAVPRAFANALIKHQGPTQTDKNSDALLKLLQDTDRIVDRCRSASETLGALIKDSPELLASEVLLDEMESNVQLLRAALSGTEPEAIEQLLTFQPSIAEDPTQAIQLINRVRPIMNVLSQQETDEIGKSFELEDSTEAVQKLDYVLRFLQKQFGVGLEQAQSLIRDKCQRVRGWKRNATIPKEIVSLVNRLPAEDLAGLVAMKSEQLAKLEQSLFLLFGTSPASIVSNVALLPDLLDGETLDLAVSASRCRKARRTELRKDNFRKANGLFAALVQTLKTTRRRGLADERVLRILEILAERQLLTSDEPQCSEQLTQFCILCLEHPGAWKQFEQLMSLVHHPLLAESRPREMLRMENEAFGTILKAPEVFLIEELWLQMVENMKFTQWTFAGLDVETAQSTEPCLFYHAVQHRWLTEYDRNAAKLMQQPMHYSNVKRRGKSITDVQKLLPRTSAPSDANTLKIVN